MINKHKKYYQTIQEDIPVSNICFKIIQVELFSPDKEILSEIDLKYKTCVTNIIMSIFVNANEITVVDDCVLLSSLKGGNAVEKYFEIPSTEKVEDAILNDGGVITIPISDLSIIPSQIIGSLTITFSVC